MSHIEIKIAARKDARHHSSAMAHKPDCLKQKKMRKNKEFD